jgi:hypothetical protein
LASNSLAKYQMLRLTIAKRSSMVCSGSMRSK